ncbi:hypothetical protein P692DRAFT_20842082 [Suillus brevipes Sb2]|nr:hypothetical protein P692DRAFT_20842082 [Suillus brevipes Sb2]
MKDQSSVKAANVSARPSPMGIRQPLPRPYRSGSQYFPPNVLTDEGDSMETLSLPPTPTPNPKPNSQPTPNDTNTPGSPATPTSAPPPVAAGVTTPVAKNTPEDLSDSIHAPRDEEDTTMSEENTIPNPFTPPSTTTSTPSKPVTHSEEDLLRAHLAVAETNRSIVKLNGSNSLTAIPHFTPVPIGGFPQIHLSHAAQLFDFQAPKVITAWLKVPHPKLLLRVFDHDGKNPSAKGPIFVEHLRKAITDIANFVHDDNQEVKVSPPCPDATIKDDDEHPISFLAYNFSEETKNFILSQRIWSSPDVTFAAHQFSVNTPPLLLFCLHGFSTTDTKTVKDAVYETWSEEVTRWDIGEILAESDIPYEEKDSATWELIKTLWVERLDYKVSGGIPLPRYNVFAASPTSNPAVWTKLRLYLHSLVYPSELEGTGTAIGFSACSLCHSIAHPRGLCPFPEIPLWNGPKHHNPKSIANQRGRGRGRKTFS